MSNLVGNEELLILTPQNLTIISLVLLTESKPTCSARNIDTATKPYLHQRTTFNQNVIDHL